MARNLFVFAVAILFVTELLGIRLLVEVIGHKPSEREAVDKHGQWEKRLSDVAEKLKVFHVFVCGWICDSKWLALDAITDAHGRSVQGAIRHRSI